MTILLLAAAVFLVQAGFHGYTATLPLALSRGGVADAAIGLIVGVSAIVQIPAAVVGGRFVDRFGGQRLFIVGAIAYLLGSLILASPVADPAVSVAPFVVARLFQGLGVALVMPCALALVPLLLPSSGHVNGLSLIGAAGNLVLVVLPPLSLALLEAAGLHLMAAVLAGFIVLGIVAFGLMRSRVRLPAPTPAAATRRFGIVFRRAWAVPLLITVCYVAYWGAVTAYLPLKAEGTGADVGLFFAADGIGVFAMRMPTAWLAARFSSRVLIAAGAALTAISIAMLLLPLSTPMLFASGLLGGGASAAVLSPVLFELNRRSTDADRGSAFALYSGALAGAISLGSIGSAPIVAALGLSAALVAGVVLIVGALVLALADPSLNSLATDAMKGATTDSEAPEGDGEGADEPEAAEKDPGDGEVLGEAEALPPR